MCLVRRLAAVFFAARCTPQMDSGASVSVTDHNARGNRIRVVSSCMRALAALRCASAGSVIHSDSSLLLSHRFFFFFSQAYCCSGIRSLRHTDHLHRQLLWYSRCAHHPRDTRDTQDTPKTSFNHDPGAWPCRLRSDRGLRGFCHQLLHHNSICVITPSFVVSCHATDRCFHRSKQRRSTRRHAFLILPSHPMRLLLVGRSGLLCWLVSLLAFGYRLLGPR